MANLNIMVTKNMLMINEKKRVDECKVRCMK